MIDEYKAAFPTQVADVQKTVTVGSGTLDKYGDPTTTITASVSGVNRAVLDDLESDTPLLAGRWLRDDDGDRRICVVSEKFVQQTMGCTNAEAVGPPGDADHQQYALYFLRGRRLHLRRYQQLNVRHGGRRRHPDQPLHPAGYRPRHHRRCRRLPDLYGAGGRRGGHQQLCDHHRLLFCQLLHPQRHLDSGGQQPFHPGGAADQHAQHHQPGHLGHCGHQPAGGRHRRHEHHDGVRHRAHPRESAPARRWAPATRPSACSLSPSQWCFA